MLKQCKGTSIMSGDQANRILSGKCSLGSVLLLTLHDIYVKEFKVRNVFLLESNLNEACRSSDGKQLCSTLPDSSSQKHFVVTTVIRLNNL